jgi:Flp pilus assembly protein TadD
VLSGLAFGLLILNRPNAILAVTGLGLLAALSPTVRKKHLATTVLVGAGLLVAVTPVLLRNVTVANTWSITSSHGGLNFAIGNGPDATGFYRPLPGIAPDISGQSADTRRVAEAALGRPLSDREVSTYFFDQGLSWITSHPVDAATLFLKKVALTVHSAPIALPYSYAFFSQELDTPLRWFPIEPWLFVPLGLVGLVSRCRSAEVPGGRGAEVPKCRSAVVAVVAFAVFYALSVAVFFVADRYRLALYVPLLVGAGIAVDTLASRLASRQWRTLVVPGLGLAAAALVVNWPLQLADGRFEEGLRLAQRHAMLGQHDEAGRWVERLTALAQRPGAAQVGLGMQYQKNGDHVRAAAWLADGLRREPGHAVIAEALARSLRTSGNTAGITAALTGIDPAANPQVDADTWLSMGRLAAGASAPDLADRFFSSGARLAPNNPDALLQWGVNLLVLSRFAEARAPLEHAARLAPRDVEALAHLALCYFQLGALDDARRAADAALALVPDHPMATAVRSRTAP